MTNIMSVLIFIGSHLRDCLEFKKKVNFGTVLELLRFRVLLKMS